MQQFVSRRGATACLIAAHVLLISVCVVLGSPALSQSSPNVVLFVVDDLGWADNDLDYANAFAQERGDTDAFFETPNLRALAGDGTLFTQAYTSSPVCSPTRASLMLGDSVARHKVSQFIGGPDSPGFSYQRSLPGNQLTIAENFTSAGYRNAYAGKWHLGPTPIDHGFQENYGGGGQGLPPTWFADSGGGFDWANGLPDDGSQFAGEYLTDRLTRESVDFIGRQAAADEPFFLNLSHYGVHVPFQAPQDLIDKYAAKLDAGSYQQFDDLTASQRQEVAIYAAMTESVDQSLGAVRQALVDHGVADNTVFAFISDNGGLATPDFGNFAADDMNAPLRNGKGTLYEGGVRSPLIISGPGLNAGAVSDTAVIAHDLYATLLNQANAPGVFAGADSVDLAPLLTDPEAEIDRGLRELVVHYPHTSNQGGRPSGSIYDEDWKVIQSYENGRVELYDLANDLGEITNLASSNPTQAEQLRVRLHRFLELTDADLPTPFAGAFSLDTQYAGAGLAIENPSFEAQPVGDGLFGNADRPDLLTPTGWSWINGVTLDTGGVANPGATLDALPILQFSDGQNSAAAMDGAQLAYFGSFTDIDGNDVAGQIVGLEQTLSATLTPATSYTVRVGAGLGFEERVPLEGIVRLLAGDVLLGEFEVTNGLRNRIFENQFRVDHTEIDPALLGETLSLQLLRGPDGGNVLFDNVRLYADLVGDYDGNGIVAQSDLDLVLLNWGSFGAELPVDWINDRDAVSFVGQAELDAVLLNWGNAATGRAGLSSLTPIPEPSAAFLMMAGLWARRRRA